MAFRREKSDIFVEIIYTYTDPYLECAYNERANILYFTSRIL